MSICSYVLPLRRLAMPDCELSTLAHDVRRLIDLGCETIVVDGSPPPDFARHAHALPGACRHVPVDQRFHCLNGKVEGVRTGLALASCEYVVIADDDIVYEPDDLRRVCALLATHDLVVPQNFFRPLPLWARIETGRILLNRAFRPAGDYPGTHAVRRSSFLRIGPYDGDTLFENEEMRRHFLRRGARVAHARDVLIARRPPSFAKWREQRVRQAYEDLWLPVKTAAFAALLPAGLVALLVAGVPWAAAFATVVAAVASLAAATGRRGPAARRAYPFTAVLLAPLWVAERAVTVHRALAARWLQGGWSYGGRVIARGLGGGSAAA